jgi:hypothetical protein
LRSVAARWVSSRPVMKKIAAPRSLAVVIGAGGEGGSASAAGANPINAPATAAISATGVRMNGH